MIKIAFNCLTCSADKPEIRLRNYRLGQYLGKGTILECLVRAGPQGTILWLRGEEPIPRNSNKYRTELYQENLDTDTLSLRIRDIQITDFGVYTCKASNILGEDEKQMVLYGKLSVIRGRLPVVKLKRHSTRIKKTETSILSLVLCITY